MKKILAVALALVTCIVALAQDVGFIFKPKGSELYPVVTRELGTVRSVLGSRIDLTYSAVAGADNQLRPVAGFALSITRPVADNVKFTFGPALLYQGDRLRTPGILVGISAKF